MRIEVDHGGELAAELEDGRAPAYHAASGERVRALLARPHVARNRWTGQTATVPPPASPAWWATAIPGAGLAAHGLHRARRAPPRLGRAAAGSGR
ncbi:MAG TPA: hypothetical protein VF310_12295, partial [Vicinamibacteria bacterium]